MSRRTFGHLGSLEEYTERTLASLPALQEAVDAYRAALVSAVQARSDLPVELDDHRSEADELVDALIDIDQIPAAFAFALRELDAGGFEFRRARPGWSLATSDDHAAALAFARIDHPFAADHQVHAIASGLEPHVDEGSADGITGPDGSAADVVHGPPHPAARPLSWLDVSLTGAGAALTHLDRRRASPAAASGAGGARRSAADRGARPSSRAGKVAKGAIGPAGTVIAGTQQHLDDAGDHALSTGQRVARIGAAVAIESPIAGGAAAGGAMVGGGLGGIPGAVGGALAGADLGDRASGWLRRRWPVTVITDGAAEGIDRLLGTGHTDGYTEQLDLRPPR